MHRAACALSSVAVPDARQGPDIQYADRNDMQRIFSGVVKNSLFAWGKYEGGGPTDAPTCRHVRQPLTIEVSVPPVLTKCPKKEKGVCVLCMGGGQPLARAP